MELVLATRNPGKVIQIRQSLEGLGISILSLDDAGIEGEAVEDGATLEENSRKKALYVWERKGMWCLAEDTALYIDALNGAPGIYAKRWAGEGKSTVEIQNFTLEQMKNVPENMRTATFRTVATLIPADGAEAVFVGELHGSILTSPRTACQPGMPYSAIFMPVGQNKVFSEMTTDEMNRVSHRGKAMAKLREHLKAARK